MTILSLLLSAILAINGVVCQTGTLSQYAERPTREVLYNRSISGRTAYTLPDNWRSFDGFLAVRDCSRLGDVVTVIYRHNTRRMLIFDCSGDAVTTNWMTRNNIIGELDYWTAKDWNILGRGALNARVCQDNPLSHAKQDNPLSHAQQDKGTIHKYR